MRTLFHYFKLKTPYVVVALHFCFSFRLDGMTSLLCHLVREQQRKKSELTPDVIMIDGNGILHPNRLLKIENFENIFSVSRMLQKIMRSEHSWALVR